jgi:hypothetical protein
LGRGPAGDPANIRSPRAAGNVSVFVLGLIQQNVQLLRPDNAVSGYNRAHVDSGRTWARLQHPRHEAEYDHALDV